MPGAKFTLRPSLAFSYFGSVTARHSSSGLQPIFATWYKELGCWQGRAVFSIPVFGEAAITWALRKFRATFSSVYVLDSQTTGLLWSPYVIGQTIIFLPCDFCLLSFFFSFLAYSPRSEIGCLPYFHTWSGLSANLECMSMLHAARWNTGLKKVTI